MHLQDLVPAIAVLGMTGVMGGIYLLVMASLNLNGTAGLFVGNATTGISNLGSQLALIGTVVGLAVVLGVVITAFGAYFFGQRGRR
jgi:hypothetical protein